ncbi:translation factor SUA5 [Marinobacter pelagius]|uniref:Threonylcarbamoyl-AMP synthase n=1 Tax=Marinobacter pelagius TaxID=379482 RepID=A0A366GRG5_9GAMM|nr:L-threonylcarbamoyladenylate synthase [Marinobacter pelagius]RBP30023.1 translation factor SUA5 [Marinobacter pelagius]
MPHTLKLDATQSGAIEHAANLLRRGQLVALPTETVYGLAGDAANPRAVKKIFEAKQRPLGHPLIVHLSDPRRIEQWASKVPETAWKLIEEYWPGPLTLLLPKKDSVSDFITGGQPGIALRMPAHRATLETIKLLGRDIVAPSANPYGRVSPTSAEHVINAMSGRIDAVLDGGHCTVGIESTIVDLTGERPSIARPGQISQRDIEQCLGISLSGKSPSQQAVPGNVKRHYQPNTPTIGLPAGDFSEQFPRRAPKGARIGVIWWQSVPGPEATESTRLAADPDEYARMLYTAMHSMDQAALDYLFIELPPETDRWMAVHDRLRRACSR